MVSSAAPNPPSIPQNGVGARNSFGGPSKNADTVLEGEGAASGAGSFGTLLSEVVEASLTLPGGQEVANVKFSSEDKAVVEVEQAVIAAQTVIAAPQINNTVAPQARPVDRTTSTQPLAYAPEAPAEDGIQQEKLPTEQMLKRQNASGGANVPNLASSARVGSQSAGRDLEGKLSEVMVDKAPAQQPDVAQKTVERAAVNTVRHAAPVHQLADQIAHMSRNGLEQLRFSLQPADLGRVDISMQIKDGATRITIAVEQPAALDALRNSAGGLQYALQAAGIDVRSDDVRISLAGERENEQRLANDDRPDRRRDDATDDRRGSREQSGHAPTDDDKRFFL